MHLFLFLLSSLSVHAMRATAAMTAPLAITTRASVPLMLEGDLSIDLASLTRRIERVKTSVALPAVVAGNTYLLPNQRMMLRAIQSPFSDLLLKLWAAKHLNGQGSTIALMMLTPSKNLLNCGVEASVDSMTQEQDGSWTATLYGKRIVRFIGALEETDYQKDEESQNEEEQGRWFTARVASLDLEELDALDVQQADESSRELDFVSAEIVPLLELWLDLMKRVSIRQGLLRTPESLSLHLEELGPVPAANEYSLRALWVASLLSPGPAKVAQELRPQMLAAESALERLHVAKSGLLDSIKRLQAAEEGRPLFDDQ